MGRSIFGKIRRFWLTDRLMISVLLIAVFSCSYFIFDAITAKHVAHAQVAVSPYVAQFNVIAFGSAPMGKLISSRIIARRSDGAKVLRETIMFPSGQRTTRRITFMDGRVLVLDDLISAKSSYHRYSGDALTAYRMAVEHPAANCARSGETVLGYKTVMKERVAVVQETAEVDGVPRMFQYWRAPALGCQTLHYEERLEQSNGTWTIGIEGTLVSLSLQEPPASLFDEGNTYTELPPSERIKAKFHRLGISADDPGLQQWMRRSDEDYFNNR